MKIWKKYPTTQGCLVLIFIALIFFIIVYALGWLEFPFGFFIGAVCGLVSSLIIDLVLDRKVKVIK